MKKLSLIPKISLAAVLVAGALSLPASGLQPQACPENYSPVICSNGVVYSNACFAGLAHATGCVPYGDAF